MTLVARLAGIALAAMAITGLVAPGVAGAAQPVVQACVGTTFSGAAHSLPPGGVGLGANIQQLQAGLVPDSVVPNTCNG